jgi:hypothetical protein
MNTVINFEAVYKTKECVTYSQLLMSDYYVWLVNNTAVFGTAETDVRCRQREQELSTV